MGEKGMEALINLGAGDMRRTLNILQVGLSSQIASYRGLKFASCWAFIVACCAICKSVHDTEHCFDFHITNGQNVLSGICVCLRCADSYL